MYKHILMPLAYQPGHSPKVETRAARAISAPGAHITLLHVIGPIPEFRSEHATTREGLAEVIRHDLERIANDFVDAEVEVREGDPATQILDLADARDIDCIVMAPHRSDAAEYGSTAAQVLRHAPCTVHLVR